MLAQFRRLPCAPWALSHVLSRLSQCCCAFLQQGADGADERLPAAGAGAAPAGPLLAAASCRQRWQPGKLCILQHLERSLDYHSHLCILQQIPPPPPPLPILQSPAKSLHLGATQNRDTLVSGMMLAGIPAASTNMETGRMDSAACAVPDLCDVQQPCMLKASVSILSPASTVTLLAKVM